jgi:hypothetical protein
LPKPLYPFESLDSIKVIIIIIIIMIIQNAQSTQRHASVSENVPINTTDILGRSIRTVSAFCFATKKRERWRAWPHRQSKKAGSYPNKMLALYIQHTLSNTPLVLELHYVFQTVTNAIYIT